MSDTNKKSMQKSTVQKKMVNESIASYGEAATKKRRSAISIMGSLIGLVKPLLHIMLAAIILGTAGYLCAIFLTILAGQVIVHGLIAGGAGSVKTIITVMIIIAVLRGILHYAEQYCNHFIAFKLLAIIRHKVFAALRKLCPAKLEGRDKGNLISIITTDIELLEVFYAHTISPIAIAALTSLVMVFFIGRYHWLAGILALAAYLVVGVVIPMWNGRRGSQMGMEFRTNFGELNSFVLDSLRGLDETIQYDQGEKRKEQMSERSRSLAGMQEKLSKMEGTQRSFTNLVILLASFGMLALTVWLYGKGEIGFEGILTCTIAMMGSFGPVVALSSLSNNLNQTLASGERVLSLLEETPMVEEISGNVDIRTDSDNEISNTSIVSENTDNDIRNQNNSPEKEKYILAAQRLREKFCTLMGAMYRGELLEEAQRTAFVLTADREAALRDCLSLLRQTQKQLVPHLPRWITYRLGRTEQALNLFYTCDKRYILYIQYSRDGSPSLCAASREMPEHLRRALWLRDIPAILTSGTLMAGNSFDRTRQLMGLSANKRLDDFIAVSPFNYKENCLLYSFCKEKGRGKGEKRRGKE